MVVQVTAKLVVIVVTKEVVKIRVVKLIFYSLIYGCIMSVTAKVVADDYAVLIFCNKIFWDYDYPEMFVLISKVV